MKKLEWILLILGFVVMPITLTPKKAECRLCYSGGCISNSICGDCVCIKSGTDVFGYCASIGLK